MFIQEHHHRGHRDGNDVSRRLDPSHKAGRFGWELRFSIVAGSIWGLSEHSFREDFLGQHSLSSAGAIAGCDRLRGGARLVRAAISPAFLNRALTGHVDAEWQWTGQQRLYV